MIFHRIPNSMVKAFCSHQSGSKVIAMECCAWHDSTPAVACVKLCSDMMNNNVYTVKYIFHRFRIPMVKSFVKWTQGPLSRTRYVYIFFSDGIKYFLSSNIEKYVLSQNEQNHSVNYLYSFETTENRSNEERYTTYHATYQQHEQKKHKVAFCVNPIFV